MSFALYLLGYVNFVIGLAWGAHLLNVPNRWIAVGVVVLLGLGIVTGATRTRRPDPS